MEKKIFTYSITDKKQQVKKKKIVRCIDTEAKLSNEINYTFDWCEEVEVKTGKAKGQSNKFKATRKMKTLLERPLLSERAPAAGNYV